MAGVSFQSGVSPPTAPASVPTARLAIGIPASTHSAGRRPTAVLTQRRIARLSRTGRGGSPRRIGESPRGRSRGLWFSILIPARGAPTRWRNWCANAGSYRLPLSASLAGMADISTSTTQTARTFGTPQVRLSAVVWMCGRRGATSSLPLRDTSRAAPTCGVRAGGRGMWHSRRYHRGCWH